MAAWRLIGYDKVLLLAIDTVSLRIPLRPRASCGIGRWEPDPGAYKQTIIGHLEAILGLCWDLGPVKRIRRLQVPYPLSLLTSLLFFWAPLLQILPKIRFNLPGRSLKESNNSLTRKVTLSSQFVSAARTIVESAACRVRPEMEKSMRTCLCKCARLCNHTSMRLQVYIWCLF